MKTNAKSCEIVFADLKGNVRGLFSTEHIVNCFNSQSYSKYLSVLENANIKKVFEDEDMLHTIRQFFDNNLNISQTSKKAFMHRNTLIYRLEKVKKLTGLNLKSFDDSIIFSNMLTIKHFFNN